MKKCCHFPICGGCTILDKAYEEQLATKENELQNLFSEYSWIKPKIVKSPQIFNYRHKVQLPFSYDRVRKQIVLGCYAKESHDVVNQSECLIQDRALTIVAHSIREWAQKLKFSSYNEKSRKGFLRHVLLRKGNGTGEILIGLVTNGDRPEGTKYLSNKLLELITPRLKELGTIVGIVQNVNKRDTNVVLGSIENVWWGRPYIKELLGSLKFKLELSTFFQVNPYQTPNLYNEALLHVPENSRVLDLYSGVGSISLWLSSKAKEVVGIEENKSSVNAAKTAASLNHIKNARFICGDVTELLPNFTNNGFQCAVIDPPRKGIDQRSIEAISRSTIERLIYVSCNPESLARDIRLLRKYFSFKTVIGVDMFPHTNHIESVALLERK